MTSSGCVLIFLEKPAAWQKLFPPSLPAKVSQYTGSSIKVVGKTPPKPNLLQGYPSFGFLNLGGVPGCWVFFNFSWGAGNLIYFRGFGGVYFLNGLSP